MVPRVPGQKALRPRMVVVGYLVGMRPIPLPEACHVWAWVSWISGLGQITETKDVL